MTIPSINPLVPSVVYMPTDAISNDSATHTKVKRISIANEPNPSSSHVITVIHPAIPETLNLLLQEGAVAPVNSEVVLNEENFPSEIPVEETQSIFNRIFFCCRK